MGLRLIRENLLKPADARYEHDNGRPYHANTAFVEESPGHVAC
jgi:hypothetical protein